MLVKCNSCDKKFNVPDSAITKAGRLVQCGSCGNTWTQYPIKEESVQKINKIIPKKIKNPINVGKIKTAVKKKKTRNLYSEEYLKKKYGLTIKDSSDRQDNKKTTNQKIKEGSSFYRRIFIFIIFIITMFGVLNLTKDFIIIGYPATEAYINYLYEVFEIIRLTINEFIN
jgi:predicted Zn finger-like uncharacterized protein